MTDIDQIRTEIETEPDRLDEYADDLQVVLESGDIEERRTVAELLREIVRQRGAPARSVLGRHTTLLDLALHDEDTAVRRFGAVATALVADTHPETVAEFVDALVEAYPALRIPSEQTIVIRALGTIGDETNTSLHQYDDWFAELLRDSNGIVPSEITGNLGNIVADAPREYPAMVRALVAVLRKGDSETRTNAMMAVALIAQKDVTVFPEADQTLGTVTQLRQNQNIDTETVNKATRMIQTAMNDQMEVSST